MVDTTKLNAIVVELLDRTQKGSLKWEPTEYRNQYQLKIGSGWIRVYYADPDYLQANDADAYSVGFFNVSDESIGAIGSSDSNSPNFILYRDLWSAVDDKIYHRSETIDSILKALDLE